MRKHTCHLDLRQRSLYVTMGQKNWVQKLLDSHEKKLLQQPRGEVRDFEESNPSFSTLSNSTTRRRWSGSFLENEELSSEKSELSKLTIDQGNLINMKSHYEQPLKYIVRL